jgi:hypothetical protein
MCKADLNQEPGNECSDEHARPCGFGRHHAQERQGYEAQLPEFCRHPVSALSHTQQPAANQTDPESDKRAEAKLLS